MKVETEPTLPEPRFTILGEPSDETIAAWAELLLDGATHDAEMNADSTPGAEMIRGGVDGYSPRHCPFLFGNWNARSAEWTSSVPLY